MSRKSVSSDRFVGNYRLLWRANMKTIAVGSMRPKAACSGKRTSVGVMSGSVIG